MKPVFWRTIKDRKRSLAIYIVSAVLFMLMYVALFPSMQQSINEVAKSMLTQMPESFLKAFGVDIQSFGTFEGFIASEYFSFIWPLLVILISVSFAGGTLAGEIEKGTMQVLLSLPISRIKLFFAKYLSGLLSLATYAILSTLAIFPMTAIFNIDMKGGNFFKLLFVGLFFGLAVYGVATFFSTIFNEKGKASFVASGVLILMYVLNIISAFKESLDSLKYFSFFYYYSPSEILVHGDIKWVGILVFLGVAAITTLASAYIFNKKDISV